MAGTTLRIVDADEGGLGWVVRAAPGQEPLTVPANREAAIRSATLAVLGGGGGVVQIDTRTGSMLEERTVGAGAPGMPRMPAAGGWSEYGAEPRRRAELG